MSVRRGAVIESQYIRDCIKVVKNVAALAQEQPSALIFLLMTGIYPYGIGTEKSYPLQEFSDFPDIRLFPGQG